MRFEVKKVENCFMDAENYEYRIEVFGNEFIELLKLLGAEASINDMLRRPSFKAELDNGVQLKGLLAKDVIKVGYVLGHAAEQKAAFEHWMAGL